MKKKLAMPKFGRKAEPKPKHITNETVAEYREQILASGRKFKYPVQYTKRRLITNALIIGALALVIFCGVTYWALYSVKTTSTFFYRLTQVIPLPVANVDGEPVRYSDYLLGFKSSQTYIRTKETPQQNSYADNSPEAKAQYAFYKESAMKDAINLAYARKIAREQGITVSNQQVSERIDELRKTASSQGEISQEAYDRSVLQIYGQTREENRYSLQQNLLRQAVTYHIDSQAQATAADIAADIKKEPGKELQLYAEKARKRDQNVQLLASGWVKKTNIDGGLAALAATLKTGQVVGPVKSTKGDGYYFVRLIEKDKDGRINYQYIKVPLTAFANRLRQLEARGAIKRYITLETPSRQGSGQVQGGQ